MPSPPDVILVLSPRMARMVKFAVGVLSNEAEFLDFDEDRQFANLDEAEDAAVALMREIDEQLAGDKPSASKLTDAMDLHASQIREEFGDNEAARIAAKMAKAARGAVEDDARGPGDGLGA